MQPGLPVLGWIGTHSTFPYLTSIFPALHDLARTHRFKLRIVGGDSPDVNIPGVELENLDWKLEREVEDFQSFDVGLYPIDPALYAEKWAAGKSGFKGIQYMAVGIPYVATPVGAMTDIGEAGVTHLHATTNGDEELRQTMGAAGRRHVLEHFSLSDQAEKLARALHEAAGDREAG
jgi:hypothetical protein